MSNAICGIKKDPVFRIMDPQTVALRASGIRERVSNAKFFELPGHSLLFQVGGVASSQRGPKAVVSPQGLMIEEANFFTLGHFLIPASGLDLV